MTAPARNSVKARRICFTTHRREDAMGICSRADARAQGLKTYFTGKPCVNGHVVYRKTNDGHCVECDRERGRKRVRVAIAVPRETKRTIEARYRENNRGAIRQRYWTNRERELARKKQYRESNRRSINERAGSEHAKSLRRQWKRANAAKAKAAKAKYYRDNPLAARVQNQRRRARLRGSEGSFTRGDFERICASQKHRCACCRKRLNLTVDHIVPLARGGTNWPSNLQGLCRSCNARKHARDPIEFMQSTGLLL